jgi:hypothetical protein
MEKTIIINLEDFDINNYYKNQGIEYIKQKHHLKDDPIIDLVLEEEAKQIMTPLEEWIAKGFKNNNKKKCSDCSECFILKNTIYNANINNE